MFLSRRTAHSAPSPCFCPGASQTRRLRHVSVATRRKTGGLVQFRFKLNGVPSCLKNRRLPFDLCPVVPLNRMTCVVYPPPLTRCGKSISATVGALASLVGGVV